MDKNHNHQGFFLHEVSAREIFHINTQKIVE